SKPQGHPQARPAQGERRDAGGRDAGGRDQGRDARGDQRTGADAKSGQRPFRGRRRPQGGGRPDQGRSGQGRTGTGPR
ncbi:MAG: pseudouridine synthase, partial [Bacteroidota bacterium]